MYYVVCTIDADHTQKNSQELLRIFENRLQGGFNSFMNIFAQLHFVH